MRTADTNASSFTSRCDHRRPLLLQIQPPHCRAKLYDAVAPAEGGSPSQRCSDPTPSACGPRMFSSHESCCMMMQNADVPESLSGAPIVDGSRMVMKFGNDESQRGSTTPSTVPSTDACTSPGCVPLQAPQPTMTLTSDHFRPSEATPPGKPWSCARRAPPESVESRYCRCAAPAS